MGKDEVGRSLFFFFQAFLSVQSVGIGDRYQNMSNGYNACACLSVDWGCD